MYDTKSSNGYQLIYEVEEKLVKAGTGNTVFIYFFYLVLIGYTHLDL